jgi:uncharacterized phage-associated protein
MVLEVVMVSVHDVAAYVLRQSGSMTAMKLQKLAYYSQAWHLVWEGRPLFPERLEAWMNGPVVPELYRRHRGQFVLDSWDGDPDALSSDEAETVDTVLAYYGDWSPAKLSTQTHHEDPWVNARKGLDSFERGNREITPESMQEFYDALYNEGE